MSAPTLSPRESLTLMFKSARTRLHQRLGLDVFGRGFGRLWTLLDEIGGVCPARLIFPRLDKLFDRTPLSLSARDINR